jgi:hypothetical protein
MRTVKSINSPKVTKSEKERKAVSTKSKGITMDTSRFKYHQTPTPATDGTQKIFTLPNGDEYVAGLLEVFLDGLLQTKGVDYTESSSVTFTMTNAPDSDEALRVNYIKTS